MAFVSLLGTPTFNTTAGPGTKTVTATPAVGDLIIIITANTGYSLSTPPTDNNASGTYTSVEARSKVGSADRIEVWIRTTLIAAASSTVFTQTTTAATTGGGLAVLKVTGMAHVGNAAKVKSGGQDNQAANAATALTWTPGGLANGNNAIIGAVFYDSLSALMTPPGGFSELSEVNYNTPPTGLEVVSVDNGLTGTGFTWGNNSTATFATVGLELESTGPLPLMVSRISGMG